MNAKVWIPNRFLSAPFCSTYHWSYGTWFGLIMLHSAHRYLEFVMMYLSFVFTYPVPCASFHATWSCILNVPLTMHWITLCWSFSVKCEVKNRLDVSFYLIRQPLTISIRNHSTTFRVPKHYWLPWSWGSWHNPGCWSALDKSAVDSKFLFSGRRTPTDSMGLRTL